MKWSVSCKNCGKGFTVEADSSSGVQKALWGEYCRKAVQQFGCCVVDKETIKEL